MVISVGAFGKAREGYIPCEKIYVDLFLLVDLHEKLREMVIKPEVYPDKPLTLRNQGGVNASG